MITALRDILEDIQEANDFLCTEKKYTQRKIVDSLNERTSLKIIDTTFYNSCVKGKATNKQKAWSLLKELENYIFEKYTEDWNKKKAETKNWSRLICLVGDWEAYSWDEGNTRLHEHSYIHSFKISIKSPLEIRCETKNNTFADGTLELITPDKVLMTLSDMHRKIVSIINLGAGGNDDLKRKKKFALAYVDSGNSSIRCGVAVIERYSGENFSQIKPESYPIEYFEGRDFKFILNKQTVLS